MEEEIATIVHDHGWYAAHVSDAQPPFLYSVGLMQTFNHPEFIIFGLDGPSAHAIIAGLISSIREGNSFAGTASTSVILDGRERQLGLRRVHPTQHPLYLGFAMGYCRHIGRLGDLEAIQMFWPDDQGKFPFQAGCELAVYNLQPRLDLALTPSEIAEFKRRWPN